MQVLASTIASDLKEANTAANAKAKELQQERLNLISVKIKEELQQDVQFEAKIQGERSVKKAVLTERSDKFTCLRQILYIENRFNQHQR